MSIYYYDIEANGLLESVTTVHSIILENRLTGEKYSASDHHMIGFFKEGYHHIDLPTAVKMLMEAEERIGHNIIGYDEVVLAKVYKWYNPKGRATDTLTLSRLLYPMIKEGDYKRFANGKIPGKLIGAFSLEAWGYRLIEYKEDYSHVKEAELRAYHEENGLPRPTKQEIVDYVWGAWNEEMQEYCKQDVRVTKALYELLMRNLLRLTTKSAARLEMDMAFICARIERTGFPVDEKKLQNLTAHIMGEMSTLDGELRDDFGYWFEPKKYKGQNVIVTPKKSLSYKDPMRANRVEGASFCEVVLCHFNPGSRDHIAKVLTERFDVNLSDGKGGRVKINDELFSDLEHVPQAAPIGRYLMLQKRIGVLSTGDQAFIPNIRDGKLHQGINPLGTITARATHRLVANIPGKSAEYGLDIRDCFNSGPMDWMCGTDMSGLELRMLGEALWPYDDGAYAMGVVEGNEDDGTDNHSVTARALGYDPQEYYPIFGTMKKGRDIAKTFIYALIYGAFDLKLGRILGGGYSEGAAGRAAIMRNIPALEALIKILEEEAKSNGFIQSLDGRRVYIRSNHSLLNFKLQSFGAIICKHWMVEMFKEFDKNGLIHGWEDDYCCLAWVHDEDQFATRTESIAHEIGRTSKLCAERLPPLVGVRVPLAAEYKVGRTWKETH